MRFFMVLALVFCSLGAAHAQKPNILFIAIDDLNDWVGCLRGHPQVKTPNIDRLAERGTLFTNAHCQAPLCNPSRTSLMMGLRPTTTGIYGLSPWIRSLEKYEDWVSLPQHLERNGYTTYSTGKIYHGGYGRRKGDQEFQHLGPGASVGARPDEKLVHTPFGDHPLVDWGTFPHDDEEKGDYKVASWAVEQLDNQRNRPFFLSAGFFLPHVPCYATEKWFDQYPSESLKLPPFLPGDRADTPRFSWYLHWELPEPRLKFLWEESQWQPLVRSYLACISFVDAQVGRVLDALERNGYQENTIVVLWSDHGFHLGEKAITGKNTLWERSTRVPLIFSGPGVGESQVCHEPAELLDIYPTLVDLCDLPQKEGLEGHSLVPQLNDPEAVRRFPAITSHNRGNHSIRSKRWRYIVYADGSEELYDMEQDPNEWRNLAEMEKYREVVKVHRQWIPEIDRKPVPGSAHRILTFEGGKAVWEGKEIISGEPIPGL